MTFFKPEQTINDDSNLVVADTVPVILTGVESKIPTESPVSTPDYEPETVEINIETTEGLTRFISAAEDVYADALQFGGVARVEEYRSLGTESLAGDEVYPTMFGKLTELQELVDLCRYEVLPCKAEITDEQFERMQTLYNEMIALRNHVFETYAPDGTAETEAEATSFVPVDVPEAVIVDNAESIPKVAENTEAVAESSQGAGMYLSAARKQAEEILDTIRTTKDILQNQTESSSASDTSELDANRSRVESLLEKLTALEEGSEDGPVIKLAVEKYQRVLGEIAKYVESSKLAATEKSELASSNDSETDDTVNETDTFSKPDNRLEDEPTAPKEADGQGGDAVEDAEVRVRRGALRVNSDQREGQVPIIVAKEALELLRKRYEKNAKELTKSAAATSLSNTEKAKINQPEPVGENLSRGEVSALATAEKNDPLNAVVPKNIQNRLSKPPENPVPQPSWTENYIAKNPSYREFVDKYFRTPAELDEAIAKEVTRIESSTSDFFERWLKELKASPFEYLKDMTIAEIDDLSRLKSSQIRQILESENIKYETFVIWVDLIAEMHEVVGYDPDMTFGELYARYVIESEIQLEAEEVSL